MAKKYYLMNTAAAKQKLIMLFPNVFNMLRDLVSSIVNPSPQPQSQYQSLNNNFLFGGGSFGGGGGGQRPVNPTNTQSRDKLLVTPATITFNEAFELARKNGLTTFEFNGKVYNTKREDLPGNDKHTKAGNQRTQEVLVPEWKKGKTDPWAVRVLANGGNLMQHPVLNYILHNRML